MSNRKKNRSVKNASITHDDQVNDIFGYDIFELEQILGRIIFHRPDLMNDVRKRAQDAYMYVVERLSDDSEWVSRLEHGSFARYAILDAWADHMLDEKLAGNLSDIEDRYIMSRPTGNLKSYVDYLLSETSRFDHEVAEHGTESEP